ncbi:MAG: hypothetical protein P1U37_08770 [Minwuia sp.]|nr:hypothetical protein [Minwuia sp.]
MSTFEFDEDTFLATHDNKIRDIEKKRARWIEWQQGSDQSGQLAFLLRQRARRTRIVAYFLLLALLLVTAGSLPFLFNDVMEQISGYLGPSIDDQLREANQKTEEQFISIKKEISNSIAPTLDYPKSNIASRNFNDNIRRVVDFTKSTNGNIAYVNENGALQVRWIDADEWDSTDLNIHLDEKVEDIQFSKNDDVYIITNSYKIHRFRKNNRTLETISYSISESSTEENFVYAKFASYQDDYITGFVNTNTKGIIFTLFLENDDFQIHLNDNSINIRSISIFENYTAIAYTDGEIALYDNKNNYKKLRSFKISEEFFIKHQIIYGNEFLDINEYIENIDINVDKFGNIVIISRANFTIFFSNAQNISVLSGNKVKKTNEREFPFIEPRHFAIVDDDGHSILAIPSYGIYEFNAEILSKVNLEPPLPRDLFFFNLKKGHGEIFALGDEGVFLVRDRTGKWSQKNWIGRSGSEYLFDVSVNEDGYALIGGDEGTLLLRKGIDESWAQQDWLGRTGNETVNKVAAGRHAETMLAGGDDGLLLYFGSGNFGRQSSIANQIGDQKWYLFEKNYEEIDALPNITKFNEISIDTKGIPFLVGDFGRIAPNFSKKKEILDFKTLPELNNFLPTLMSHSEFARWDAVIRKLIENQNINTVEAVGEATRVNLSTTEKLVESRITQSNQYLQTCLNNFRRISGEALGNQPAIPSSADTPGADVEDSKQSGINSLSSDLVGRCLDGFKQAVNLSEPQPFQSIVIGKAAPTMLLIFFLATLGAAYRYLLRLAVVFDARADAILLWSRGRDEPGMLHDKIEELRLLTEMMTAEKVGFKETRLPIDSVTDVVKTMLEKSPKRT